MDIILVPGFWLDASSWSEVTPPLAAAGHRVHPLTLPGLESADAPRSEAGDLVDLDEELRAEFRARAIPHPRGAAADKQELHDERRYEVPATVIACEFPSSVLAEMIEGGHPYVAELGRIRNVEYVDLPTGHWPQFTKPGELGAAILAAVDRSS
jgi:pimeloyl-ACP methyl ester carboxylesterase